MTFNISDLMDGLGDETLTLADPEITSPERVLALVRERSGATAAPARHEKAATKKTNKAKPHRLGRILLIAAALTALLSVTAYAVYELVIDRYVIDQPAWYESEEEAAADPVSRISLVGYQGTPEYLAFTEWEGLQKKWWAESEAFWQELGVDDSYHETPDNYAAFYNAVTRDQAEQVDAILEKYGLTAHETMGIFYSAADLYDALGTEPFYSDTLAGASQGYIYDDGTFKDEGRRIVLSGGRAVSVTVFVSAKGSFADISGPIDLSQGCDEWSYTTAGGVTVDLILTPNQAKILAETDGAYIDVGLNAGSAPGYDPAADPMLSEEQRAFYLEDLLQVRPDMTEAEMDAEWDSYRETHIKQQQAVLPPAVTRAEIESIADCISFDVLAERFDGQSHPETAKKVTALAEQMQAEREAAQAKAEADRAQAEDASDDVIARLGSYGITALPEGYENVWMQGYRQQDHRLLWTELDDFDQVTRSYWNQELQADIELNVFRFFTDADRSESATAEALENARMFYCGADHPLTDINGCEGFVLAENGKAARAVWYDGSRDLLFMLEGYQEGYDTDLAADEMLALAGSVTEGEPAPPEEAVLPEGVPPTPAP